MGNDSLTEAAVFMGVQFGSVGFSYALEFQQCIY